MPRSRAPGYAVWRVRAAHAPAIAPLRGAPAGACASRRQPLTDTDVSASGCRRAPERPAHAPSGRSHAINHLARIGPDRADVAETELRVGEARDLDDVARMRRLDETAVADVHALVLRRHPVEEDD